jgi:dTDP-4-dehydrorhamnose reductase
LKVVLTGSSGMLGHDIAAVFEDHDLEGFSSKDLDITDREEVYGRIRDLRPDLVIHAAAYTDVDGCESDRDRAFRINGIGTRNLAIACQSTGCPIVYISSDYVFDGKKGSPYTEWDDPNPVNVYGLSKLMGERFIVSLTNRFFIVRTSWLFGKAGRNFVDTICCLLQERDAIDVVDDQVGCPTYTRDLALKLREVIQAGYGIYHVTNSSHCSWYEFAAEIARLQSSDAEIRPVSSDKFGRPAVRPAFSALDNMMLRLESITPLRDWKDALAEYLKS